LNVFQANSHGSSAFKAQLYRLKYELTMSITEGAKVCVSKGGEGEGESGCWWWW
jgi:hypothetical protein